ncbi:NAD(P)-binding protein, partial [Candidatus Neomarinimicrobiota bacterium]
MSDKLNPFRLRKLLKWILLEEKHGSIFSIPKELFHTPNTNYDLSVNRYNQILGTPIGVAAGPHTQLSQNIVAAYLCGARYLELKTVQTLDEIEVTKPCIDMTDEGYNCEWSQELKTHQSINEYLNAWIVIHILRDLLDWQDDQHGGFIFNLSIGYDFDGIQKPNVQDFLNKMENCQTELDTKLNAIADLYPNVKNLSIPSCISNNITLSTMHGCPPNEIEKIGQYLIETRKYHTAIKLNPTLLGPEHLREILNNQLGYDNVYVPDQAFDHDLKYPQALTIINNLSKLSKKAGVSFGLKLTNTLEVNNSGEFLPAGEKMSYLSGRALHPISINLAAKLQSEYNGGLDISFCAGADCFNISDIIACDLAPVTVCSDLLKPGGYGRLSQYLEILSNELKKTKVASISEFINIFIDNFNTQSSGLETLHKYSSEVLTNPAYQKHNKHFESIKTDRELNNFDCIEAPCIDACAIGQDIPEYLYQASNGNIDNAFSTILKTNPLPGITGNVCDHLCQLKCTRNNYDETLKIREIKRFITENQNNTAELNPKPMNGKKVAIIGAGPSGLTCAYFLALDGFEVEIFESKSSTGGMVSGAIPEFRLTDKTIKDDIELITALGVKIKYNQNVDSEKFTEIQSIFDFIYIAIGAQKNKLLDIPGINAKGV